MEEKGHPKETGEYMQEQLSQFRSIRITGRENGEKILYIIIELTNFVITVSFLVLSHFSAAQQ